VDGGDGGAVKGNNWRFPQSNIRSRKNIKLKKANDNEDIYFIYIAFFHLATHIFQRE
jgi:hypothetical protein